MLSPILRRLWEVTENNAGFLLIVASEAFYARERGSFYLGGMFFPPLNLMNGHRSLIDNNPVDEAITYVCSVAYMYYGKVDHAILGPPGIRHLLLYRGIFGIISVQSIYYSIQYLPLSDAAILTFLAPLCTAVVGSFVLNEKFTKGEALAGIVSLLGVVLIAQPPFIFGTAVHNDDGDLDVQRMVAVGVSLIGVLGLTGAFISIRAAGTRAHPLHNLAYFSAFCFITSAVGMIITHTPITIPSEWPLFIMLPLSGVFGFIALMLMTMGLQIEAAGRATMGTYTQVIFAMTSGWAVFGTVPSPLSILGSALILGPALYVALTKEGGRDSTGKIALPEGEEDEGVEEGLIGSRERVYRDMGAGET
ncbi:hypothetical protein AX15_000737 [Amanita polypyramis BW_CC]|nr:hypothetical protein AX15_000737 [Amanita polypyramis BW_CC]